MDKCFAHLYDPKTNTRTIWEDPYGLKEDTASELEGLDFIWREGNNSCDCNKAAYMDLPNSEIYPCDKSIVLEKLILEDGRTLIENNKCLALYRDGHIIEFSGKQYKE